MEFHLLCDNTNRIYDTLDKFLKRIGAGYKADKWNVNLSFQRPKFKFKGGQHSKLLKIFKKYLKKMSLKIIIKKYLKKIS